MTTQALPEDLPVSLPVETKNRLVSEVAHEAAERMEQELVERVRDGIMATFLALKGKELWDVFSAGTFVQDLPILFENQYIDLYKAKLIGPPVSPLWQAFIVAPAVFEFYRKEFVRMYRERASKDAGTDA